MILPSFPVGALRSVVFPFARASVRVGRRAPEYLGTPALRSNFDDAQIGIIIITHHQKCPLGSPRENDDSSRTVLLHDLQELDDHLGHRAHQHLTLSTLFGVVHRLYSSHTHTHREREREKGVSTRFDAEQKQRRHTQKKERRTPTKQGSPRRGGPLGNRARKGPRDRRRVSIFAKTHL